MNKQTYSRFESQTHSDKNLHGQGHHYIPSLPPEQSQEDSPTHGNVQSHNNTDKLAGRLPSRLLQNTEGVHEEEHTRSGAITLESNINHKKREDDTEHALLLDYPGAVHFTSLPKV
jgi:hypothetical protein